MRFLGICSSLIVLAALAAASDIKIQILDPSGAAISGAQATLRVANEQRIVAVQNSSAEGIVLFAGVAAGSFQARILAPGFAEETVEVRPSGETITVRLRIVPSAETVVVTATRTPVPTQTSGSEVSTLSGGTLETMNPVASNDALRFLPGAIVDTAGQFGGLASLFVRGGDSRYNKVIVDGVTINEPGGRFDFGTLPLAEADRLEFSRGAQSTLYGSDAMTSVVQVWTRTGSTATPELRFGADGGNFETASGYLSLSGAHGRYDYNVFGDQFNSGGSGPNDDYSNSMQGGNVGISFSDRISLRLRARHSNSRSGVQNEWNFNGQTVMTLPDGQTFTMQPDLDQYARLNDTLVSAELNISGPSHWQHRLTGFEFNLKRTNVDQIDDPGRTTPFGDVDFPFHSIANQNRAGFEYQGDYIETNWAQTTIGYRFEDENGFVGDLTSPPIDHGLRLNHDVYAQQQVNWKRLSAIAGIRFVHNGSFGNRGVPRVALSLLALRGNSILSGTRLRFSYSTGIKEPLLEESFASGPFTIPNPNLKPERNRSFEAGFQQNFLGGNYVLTATYFNNLFRDQIEFASDPNTFIGQYENVNESIAHGAEVEFQGTLSNRLTFNTGYTYTSTQILSAPLCTPANFCDPLLSAGQELIRRPRHSATAMINYLSHRWGANLSGSFVGRRADSDFFGFGIDHAPGYVVVNAGGWYAVTSRVSTYINVGNLFDKSYNEVVGYPALGINFRAGMRFRIGGE